MKVWLQSYAFTIFLSLTLALNGTFFFTQQPLDTELQEGEEAMLYCTVSPLQPGLKYTWYKREQFKGEDSVIETKLSPLEGEERAVLHYSTVSRANTGYYHCKVETEQYKVFSNTAFLRVDYFTEPNTSPATQNIRVSENEAKKYLPCDTIESSPIMDVTWTKNDKAISSDRMFVFPEDWVTPLGVTVTRGTLVIINVRKGEDDAMYKCLTKEALQIAGGVVQRILLSIYKVTTTVSGSLIDRIPTLLFKSYNSDEGSVDIMSGGAVTLVCAGAGYPTPTYQWFEQSEDGSEVQIRGSDSLLLEDHNRQLVASNIVSSKVKHFICKIVNTYNGEVTTRPHNFYITAIGDANDYNIDILAAPNPWSVLKPNRYTPFTLECAVRKTGQIQILWLKNGKKMEWNARITIDDSESETTSTNLVFQTTNENDLGVYQCVIFNDERLKVETAYVTLEKDLLPFELSSRDPRYEFLHGPFLVYEAEEACRSRDGHLVSILNESENGKVHELVQENNVESVWIGLTREVPEPIGVWLWTQSVDMSTTYSNWDDDKPDNKHGYQEYTVMSASNGKWVDVNKKTRRPAVCKRYLVRCLSVDKFYNGRVKVRGWESVDAKYQVGEQVQVSCRFSADRNVTHVTCHDNMKFEPDALDECPADPTTTSSSSSHTLHTVSLLFFILSTSS